MTLQKSIRLFFAVLLLFMANAAFSQRSRDREIMDEKEMTKKEKEREAEDESFASHLWYGGSVGLNFYSFNGGNVFYIGLSPMVGYKIIEPISVGPRVSVNFSSLKYPNYKALGLFDVEVGAFMRFRAYRGFFLQGEMSNTWSQQPEFLANGDLSKYSIQRFNQYLGAGYNFGNGEGGTGSEIGVFYNFAIAADINGYQNPFDLRFGFTWKF